jgi:hypothetical protein
MNDNIDQIYLINKILQLTERISILEKKMQSYENNNNKILFQQSTNNSLNNIQNLNDIEKIYDPINNNTIFDLSSNNVNIQNNNINMQNNINIQNNNKRINNINNDNDNEVNKIYDPLSN